MKEFIGIVVSKGMLKTALVEVKRTFRHPIYKKFLTRSTKFKVHDEMETKVGDNVKIQETKPISKEKNFKVVEIVNHSETAMIKTKKKESKS